MSLPIWSLEEDKRFESALSHIPEDNPDRWELAAEAVGGSRTAEEVIARHDQLFQDIGRINSGLEPLHKCGSADAVTVPYDPTLKPYDPTLPHYDPDFPYPKWSPQTSWDTSETDNGNSNAHENSAASSDNGNSKAHENSVASSDNGNSNAYENSAASSDYGNNNGGNN